MKKTAVVASVLVVALAGSAATGAEQRPWCDTFSVDKAELTDIGRNFYFNLWPGYRLFLQHGNEELVISVLTETKVVDGVKTRVVEERESKDGKLVEVSRNYVAISRMTGDVYYFGEDVDTYKDGKVTGHGGSWRAGVNGAKFGLLMPGRPEVGDRFYQEVAPGVAMDRGEVISLREDFQTPAKAFENCLRIRETSALEKGGEDKLYAPEVGLIKDGKLVLVKVDCPTCGKENDVPAQTQ
jgi:hypothetical protein